MKGSAMSENTRIWSQWCETPPSHTKEVRDVGRKFTAIDAYYQMQRATELFGPVGSGWGWDKPETEIVFPETPRFSMLLMRLYVWVEKHEQGIHLTNSQQMFFKQGEKLDDDVFKKLLTDTITKGLSYWGCSADVFLGLYDDNRYVAKMAREEEQRAKQGQSERKPAPSEPAKPSHSSAGGAEEKPKSERMQLFDEIRNHASRMGLKPVPVSNYLKEKGLWRGDVPIEELQRYRDQISRQAEAIDRLWKAARSYEKTDQHADFWMDDFIKSKNLNLFDFDLAIVERAIESFARAKR